MRSQRKLIYNNRCQTHVHAGRQQIQDTINVSLTLVQRRSPCMIPANTRHLTNAG